MATRLFRKKWNWIELYPPQALATGFILLIFIGGFLLWLPISTNPGHHLSFLDALFEATSAVCVTGLVVVDTKTTFTLFGQIVILALIQIGGLGFVTFGVFIAIFLGKTIGLKERLIVQSQFNLFHLAGVIRLVKMIVAVTFLIEGIGALFLTLIWSKEMGIGQAIFYGIFHSVSSFNNAGFDLMGDFSSLTRYVTNAPVNLVISALFIIGGLGFTVIIEVWKKRTRWSLHTRLVLYITLWLNVVATVLVFLLEYDNPKTLGALSFGDKLLAAYFHGTVPRTAGFNTLDLTALRTDTQMLTMALMFIGGSSGSTAGGIKITTFFLLLLVVKMFITNRAETNVMERRIPYDLVFRALTITTLGVIAIFIAVFLLNLTEKHLPFEYLLFEAVSAFGTVGLSLGVTPQLTAFGKVVIMLMMFIGRLGPLTVVFALTQKQKNVQFRYPEEKILIG